MNVQNNHIRNNSGSLPVSSRSHFGFLERAQPLNKRLFDILVAALLLLLISPVLAVLWAAVKCDGGPGLFRHQRVGLNGRSFECLKLRTMVANVDTVLAAWLVNRPAAHKEWVTTGKLKYDPRLTKLGRILRMTSLDEIPQLLNVLSGDMSLVGPRPVVRQEFEVFYTGDAGQAYLSVRPGITGLWQVSGRSTIGYADRVALDLYYVQNMSMRADLRILLHTIPAVLSKQGAW